VTRADALVLLLSLEPPAALPVERIGHHYTCPKHKGDPELIKRDLGTAYVAHRRNDRGQDISCVVSHARKNRCVIVMALDFEDLHDVIYAFSNMTEH
jgi:hypothetical protein